jgi:hypothetical protein
MVWRGGLCLRSSQIAKKYNNKLDFVINRSHAPPQNKDRLLSKAIPL